MSNLPPPALSQSHTLPDDGPQYGLRKSTAVILTTSLGQNYDHIQNYIYSLLIYTRLIYPL